MSFAAFPSPSAISATLGERENGIPGRDEEAVCGRGDRAAFGSAWRQAKGSAHGELEGHNCCDGGAQRQQVGAEMRKVGGAERERRPSARPAGGKGKIATRGGARSEDN